MKCLNYTSTFASIIIISYLMFINSAIAQPIIKSMHEQDFEQNTEVEEKKDPRIIFEEKMKNFLHKADIDFENKNYLRAYKNYIFCFEFSRGSNKEYILMKAYLSIENNLIEEVIPSPNYYSSRFKGIIKKANSICSQNEKAGLKIKKTDWYGRAVENYIFFREKVISDITDIEKKTAFEKEFPKIGILDREYIEKIKPKDE